MRVADQRDASGLLCLRNRYYDPSTGHFTQQDPIGIAGGLNLYGYTNGDPINFSDPFGLCPRCVAAGIAWGLYESGSGAYDAYVALRTAFSDAPIGDKLTTVALAGVSIIGPGSGYTTLGRNARRAGTVRTGALRGYQRANTELDGGLSEATSLFRSLTGREVAGALDNQVLADGRRILFRANSRTGGPKIEIVDPEAKVLEKITFVDGGGG